MFLKQLRVENFRCLDDVEISFARPPLFTDEIDPDLSDDDRKSDETVRDIIQSRDLVKHGPVRKCTMLIGENGTGKSSLLKAIGLVTAGSSALGEIIGKPEQWIKNGKQHCKIEAVLVTAEGDERPISLVLHREDSLRDIFGRSEETLSLLDAALRHTDRNYFVVGYGASRKLAGSKSTRGYEGRYDSPRAQCVATLFDREASLHPLESWVMDMDYRDSNNMAIVRKALNKFLPGLSFHEIDKENRQLLFKTPDGPVPLEALSDGYQNMAAWIGDLLYRITQNFKDYSNPLKARGLLLIDEIDLHLHPGWQRKLLDFIRENLPNVQLITTTHSVFTVQQSGEGEVYVAEREGRKKVRVRQFEGAPNEMLIHQLLSSDLFKVETDESRMVEELKEEYRQLNKMDSRTEKQETRFRKVNEQLRSMPNHEISNSLLTSAEKESMKELIRQMNNDRSGEA